MTKIWIFTFILSLIAVSAMTAVTAVSAVSLTARAGDPAAGKQKAGTCVACHGANGISANSLWPNLAGQKEDYLVAQLKAFHDGKRINQMMNGIASMLSTVDMEDLAAYFSHMK